MTIRPYRWSSFNFARLMFALSISIDVALAWWLLS